LPIQTEGQSTYRNVQKESAKREIKMNTSFHWVHKNNRPQISSVKAGFNTEILNNISSSKQPIYYAEILKR
jgi:hypothetical protein